MPAPDLSPVITFTGELPNFLTQPPLVFAANANNSVLQWNNILQSYNISLGTVNEALVYIDEQLVLAQGAVQGATDAGNEQVQLAAGQVSAATTQAGLAATSANEAEIARNMAFSVANIAGDWPSMTGSLAQFEAVYNSNNSKIWVAKVAIPDITAVQPTTDDANWLDYFSAISAGEVVSGPSDIADAKLVNAAWLKARGIGAAAVLVAPDLNDISVATGLYIVTDATNGPPDVSPATGYLIFQRNTSLTNTMEFQEVSPPHRKFQKSRNGVNGVWKPLDNPQILLPENGGTGETTLEAAREAMEAAKRGAITGSELTMTANRVAGRLSTNGAVQELTGAQLLALSGGAAAGRVANTGITSATARLMGRVAAGTGAVAELPASDVLTFLGITPNYVGFGTTEWVNVGSGITYFKFGSYVILVVDVVNVNGSPNTNAVTHAGIVPAAYRPANNQLKNFLVSGISMTPFNVQVSLSTAGTTVITRTDATTTQGRGQVIFAYAV